MSQEKPNSQTLRSKLANLEALPGEGLSDKAAAWDVLHGRLREKPRRIKPLWYWAAAALAIACSLPFIIQNKKQEGIAKINIPQPQLRNESSMPEQISVAAAVPGTTAQRKPELRELNDITVKNSAKEDKALPIALPVQAAPQPEEIASPDVPEATQPVMAAAPVKKKLKVISLNELNAQPQQSVAASLPPATVTKKFYNLSTDMPPAKEYAGVLKIKISLKQ